MRILLALLGLTMSMGSAAACEMHRSHTAVLASASTLVVPMPGATATVAALPQSRMVEKAALAISTPELAAASFRRGCRNERQTTVYLTQ